MSVGMIEIETKPYNTDRQAIKCDMFCRTGPFLLHLPTWPDSPRSLQNTRLSLIAITGRRLYLVIELHTHTQREWRWHYEW